MKSYFDVPRYFHIGWERVDLRMAYLLRVTLSAPQRKREFSETLTHEGDRPTMGETT